MSSHVMHSIQMKSLDDIFSDQMYNAFKNLWKYTSSGKNSMSHDCHVIITPLPPADLVPLVLLLWTQAMDWKKNSNRLPLTTYVVATMCMCVSVCVCCVCVCVVCM